MSYLSSLLDKYDDILVKEETIALHKKALAENIMYIAKEQKNKSTLLLEDYRRIKEMKLISEQS